MNLKPTAAGREPVEESGGTRGAGRIPRSVIIAGWIMVALAGLLALAALDELHLGRIAFAVIFATLGVGLVRGIKPVYWIAGIGVGSVTALAALSLLDEVTKGRVIVVAWLVAVLALLFLTPSARAWASRRNRRPRESHVGDKTADGDVPVEGWTRPVLGGRLKFGFLVAVGLLMLLAGVGISLSGGAEERGPGIAVGFFGLGILLTTPLFRNWKPRGRPSVRTMERSGRSRTGLSFPYAGDKIRVAGLAALCMGAATAGFALFPDSFADPGESVTGIRAFGAFGAIFFIGGGALVLVKKAGNEWHLTLLPEGIVAVAGGSSSFAPWDAIASVRAVDFTFYSRGAAINEPFIGLNATDTDRIEISKAGRMLMKTNRLMGTDLAYPMRTLDVDPATLLFAIRFYLEHPEARSELESQAALQRVEQHRFDQ